MANSWVYCEDGPRKGMVLAAVVEGGSLLFGPSGSHDYYLVTDRVQDTDKGPIPVARYDRSDH
jgi:hypothetical protein